MRCVTCGWPFAENEVVSTHNTSEGRVRYLRCPCGRIAVELLAFQSAADALDGRSGRRSRT